MTTFIALLIVVAVVLVIMAAARSVLGSRRTCDPGPRRHAGLSQQRPATASPQQHRGRPPVGTVGDVGPRPAPQRAVSTRSECAPAPSGRISEFLTPPVYEPEDREVQASVSISRGYNDGIRSWADPNALWVMSGGHAEVAGYRIPEGMVYVGENLPSVRSREEAEPALIDPCLRVDRQAGDVSRLPLGYWPSYARIGSAARAAYLAWLAGGKQDPEIDIGYVFLYFYGLERRVLSDLAAQASPEISRIIAEVERLLGIYGRDGSFGRYAASFLAFCRAVQPGVASRWQSPPPAQRTGYELPFDLALGLGQFVAQGKTIPADWAFAWLSLHPEAYLRTPAQRCPDELKRLFEIRYREKFGEGMVVKPNKTVLAVEHRPASGSFGGQVYQRRLEIPDVRAVSGPVNRLRELGLACCDELDAFSRWVGRNPGDKHSLAAVALLPADLASAAACPAAEALQRFAEKALESGDPAVVTGPDLLGLWPLKTPGRMSKTEAIQLAQLLERWGVGLEPDVRFGGKPPVAEEAVVLFRLAGERMQAPSPDYAAATLLLHVAALVSSADGTVSEDEERGAQRYLDAGLDLSTAETARLRAHLKWLVAAQPGFGGLRKRLDALDDVRRGALSEFLVTLACADHRIDPKEVKTLDKLFDALGLDASGLHTRLHAAMSGNGPALDPVTVRPAAPREAGYAIPAPVEAGVALNMVRVQHTLAETAAVSALLGDIFTEETAPAPVPAPADANANAAGLDAAHSTFLRRLQAQAAWSRDELEEIAESLGLLVDGAIEVVNEAAYERCDEPLCDGEDPVAVDHEVLRRMLA